MMKTMLKCEKGSSLRKKERPWGFAGLGVIAYLIRLNASM
jgi:hypothetical protein